MTVPERTTHRRLARLPTLLRLLPVLFALATLTACSGDLVRGEAPFAQVTSWKIDGRAITLDLRLRNVNDAPLVAKALALSVTLDDDVLLFRSNEVVDLDMAAGGFETVTLALEASEAGTALLQDLAAGERNDLPYRLEGTVFSEKSGDLPIRRDGRIYTVPGRPGEFR